eukprot:scaffold36140_cov140-Isochrysis_galbana.AAC.1
MAPPLLCILCGIAVMHQAGHTVPPPATAWFGQELALKHAVRFGRAAGPQMMAGKGDGKQRRPKAEGVGAPSPPPPPTASV